MESLDIYPMGLYQKYLERENQHTKNTDVTFPLNYHASFFQVLSAVLHAGLLFFPRGDVSDLDRPCLSTSAGHKGPQGKLFILTSFQENKLCALGASVPQEVPKKPNPPQKKHNPWGFPTGQQLSLPGHDLSPGSGYRHGRAAAEKTSPGASLLPCSHYVRILKFNYTQINPNRGGYY